MPIGTLTALGMAAGAASGMAKSSGAQSKKDKALQLAAETSRYSPWTGMDAGAATQNAQNMQGANYLGDVVGGSTSLGMTGKNITDSDAWNKMLTDKFKGGDFGGGQFESLGKLNAMRKNPEVPPAF